MNKDIKLFLSSTFDDKMQEHRDYFRNEINAELNQIVGQIGANLFLYDYELGISEKEIFSNVLDICFQKIEESDYFVGIVGDYYGSHINDRLRENYTGSFKELVDKGIQENLSVLELEFIKSLENENQKKLFFIQDNIPENNCELKSLITRIKTNADANTSIIEYDKSEDVLFKLKQDFNNEMKIELDKLTNEQKNKNLIYANKVRYYVENKSTQTLMNELNDYINNDSRKVFVLSGKAGSGKRTSLLQWIREQEDSSNSTTKIISTFAGIDGNSISDILLNIYNHVFVDDKLDINQEEKDEKTLLNKFAQFTLEASKQFQKTILVIDGINQITFTSDWKEKYWWLNKQLENNIKVIISTTESIKDSHFEIHSMLPQNSLSLIGSYLYKEGKEQIYKDFEGNFTFERDDSLPVFSRLLCAEICMIAKYVLAA